MRHEIELSPDHPGFADSDYRARRDRIAELARGSAPSAQSRDVDYTPAEHALWAALWTELAPLHAASACAPLLTAARQCPLPHDRIPQLRGNRSRARLTSVPAGPYS